VLESLLNNIRVVMVETSHPGNIGASARAMKTMGLSNLVLVRPQNFPAQKAIWRSAGASDVVENTQVVESLEEAIADCALVIATSARQRRIPWPMVEPDTCGEKVVNVARKSPVAVVFGREDRGLHNEELQLANYHVSIPGNKDYSVLNVAAAVQVICYEIRKNALALEAQERESKFKENPEVEKELPSSMQVWDEDFARANEMALFYEHLEQVLIELDFHDPENPRQLMTRMQRLFNRAHLDKMEMNILRGVLNAVQKSLKK
jgi:tRNA (cytidine32/uridine32-2'-O)-methyltransferase